MDETPENAPDGPGGAAPEVAAPKTAAGTADGSEPRAGYLTTLRAALDGGAKTGLVLGLADGLVAAWRTRPGGLLDVLGCLAGSVLIYALTAAAVGVLLSPLTHALFGRQPAARRYRSHMALLLGLGLFVELYWWTRPFVFSGASALDPRRLASAAGLLVLGVALGFALVRLGRRLPTALATASGGLAILVSAIGVVYLGAARGSGELGKLGERNRDLPNVLLVVVDALRQDRIGVYGDETTHTPHIDALASRGVVFDNAFVQAPFTWTSFGSFLTGKYPRRHGLVKMQSGVRMAPNVTLASHLKSATRHDGRELSHEDWLAATFMTGTLSHGTGLMRGFDLYFEALVGHELVDVARPWSVFRSELLLFRTRNKLAQRFDRELVASTAASWLVDRGHRRFVAMVHFYSTHTPYDPPEEYRERYVDPAYDGPIQAFYAASREAIERGEYAPTDVDRERIGDLYQAGVTMADAMFGRLVEALEEVGALENTLVVLTSDHGEELGDHGLWEHNFMYQTNLRIPLVMSLPRALPQGTRVDGLVDSIDLLPTICSIVGVEPPPPASGPDDREGIDGLDLLPLVRGEVDAVRAHSFAENGRFLSVQDREWKLIVAADAVGEGRWERARGGDPEPSRLFNLARDPGEERNVFADEPERARDLYEVLVAWDASMPLPRMQRSDRDHENERIQRDLSALGYADGIGGEGEVLEEEDDTEASQPR